MARGMDLKPRKKKELKEPDLCPKHGILKVRRPSMPSCPSGDLRCRACYNEKSVRYRAADPVRYSKIQRQQYLRDPRCFMLSRARTRSLKHNVPFNITKEDIVIPTFCPVLGIPLQIGTGDKTDNSPSLDRIVPSKGYVIGNIEVMSDKANRIKTNASLEEIEKVVIYLRKRL